MLAAVFELARPLLYALDPEQAHELTLKSLEAGIHPRPAAADDALLGTKVWGLDFANPLGIAAGFDKDARVPGAVLAMGFGHAEIGTVTPRAQEGNPRPRVFRLIRDRALINRLGFNNSGHAAALARLTRARPKGVLGINVGANQDADDRTADYVAGVRAFYDVASYFTVNISSPNTPGLRDLQAPAALDELVGRVLQAREEMMAAGRPKRPVVVKLAPDIAEDDIAPIVRVLEARGVDGIAVSNSTLARERLGDTVLAKEAGGISGRPLFHRSTVVLARVHVLSGGRIPLIGIGGIDSGPTAIAKLEAGATLLQLYTGLVYEGPGLLARIKQEMIAHMARGKLAHIADLTGRRAEEWAAKAPEG
ncbi:MAG TPA: quinone-dependent dihydroorotate dehydrogenase [Hyphomicrobiaceae bacterium]|nr:quinone-dependent dihydroorotate dehydrogenase [Hyphomicrobiaceae bacterium]